MRGRWLALLAMGLGVVAGALVAAWLVLWVSLRSQAVRVPSVEGMESSQAVRTLEQVGLVARLQEPVPHGEIPRGRVARQRPVGGFQLKRGGTVFLYPSLGAAADRVTQVVGLPPALAEVELEENGLHLGVICQVVGEGSTLTVVAQDPPPGTLVAPGTAVSLLVNRGAERLSYVMPDLVGESEGTAASALARWGLRLQGVERVPYPGLPAGTVVRQEPAAGGPVGAGSGVLLWVSR